MAINKEGGQNLKQDDLLALLSALDQTALVSATDERGTIIYVNNKFMQVSKYSEKELIGQNHRILKSHQQPDSLFDELWGTISRGKVWRGEIKNRAKDGSFYWVDTSIAPILGDDHKPERYISVRFVITEKKTIEEDLRVQKERLEKANKLMINRELRMVELKQRLEELSEESTRE